MDGGRPPNPPRAVRDGRVVRLVLGLLGLVVVLGCVLVSADGIEIRYQLPPVDGVPQPRTAVHEPAVVGTVVAAVGGLGPLVLLVATLARRAGRWPLVVAGAGALLAVVAAAVAGAAPVPTF